MKINTSYKKLFLILTPILIVSITGNITLGVILINNKSIVKPSFDSLRTCVYELTISFNSQENYATCFETYKKGLYITNYHSFAFCISNIEKANVSIKDYESNTYEVNVARFNKEKDIALLQLTAEFSNNQLIELTDDIPTTGDTCYALANANGLGISLFNGLISNPDINLVVDGYSQSYIQSNLNAYPGCSGGCLLDKNGYCIGMISFRTKDKNDQPITEFSYSIPSRVLIEEIISIEGEKNVEE